MLLTLQHQQHQMKNFFNRILLPVGLNSNTPMAISKAIELANYFECDLHLLYVQTPVLSIPYLFDGHSSAGLTELDSREAVQKMEKLLAAARPRLQQGLLIEYSIDAGSWYTRIKETIISRHIDLVVLPRSSGRIFGALLNRIDVNRLSQQTQCPILTVTRHFELAHLQKIVVPVHDFLPMRKLTVATYLAKRFNAVIHLMGRNGRFYTEDRANEKCLTKAYNLLKDYTDVKVYCTSRGTNNLADDTLAYAAYVKADLIVVNPGTESLMKGWLSRWIGKYLYRESSIPVLTIARQQ